MSSIKPPNSLEAPMTCNPYESQEEEIIQAELIQISRTPEPWKYYSVAAVLCLGYSMFWGIAVDYHAGLQAFGEAALVVAIVMLPYEIYITFLRS